jgi:hypothetical protein
LGRQVQVRLGVGQQGEVLYVRVLSAGVSVGDGQAIAAAVRSRLRFNPAISATNGAPISVDVELTLQVAPATS